MIAVSGSINDQKNAAGTITKMAKFLPLCFSERISWKPQFDNHAPRGPARLRTQIAKLNQSFTLSFHSDLFSAFAVVSGLPSSWAKAVDLETNLRRAIMSPRTKKPHVRLGWNVGLPATGAREGGTFIIGEAEAKSYCAVARFALASAATVKLTVLIGRRQVKRHSP